MATATLSPETYTVALEAVVDQAAAALKDLWRKVGHLDALGKRRALEAFWPTLVHRYGDVAASIAADRFEDLVGLPAQLAPPMSTEDLNARARWAIGPEFSATPDSAAAVARLAGLLDEFIFTAGRSTTIASASEHGLQVARVPTGDACAWCIMLGSRGFDYASRRSAMAASHDFCRCRIVLETEDAGDYDPDRLLAIYADATAEVGASDPKAVLAKMREQGNVSDRRKR